MTVTDASPLIVLAKLKYLGLLRSVFGEVLIGPVVKTESIDAGRAMRAIEVDQIEAAIERGWLQLVALSLEELSLMQRLTELKGLGRGESEAIALAALRGLRLIVDDKRARRVAAASGVDHVGTVGVLLEAYFQQRIDLAELEIAIRDVGKVPWLSPAVTVAALELAREAADEE